MSITKAEEGEEVEDSVFFEVIILYTFAVIIITLLTQRIWKAGVLGVEILRQHVAAQPGGHSEGAVRRSMGSSSRELSQASAASSTGRINEGIEETLRAPFAPLPEEPAPLPLDQRRRISSSCFE